MSCRKKTLTIYLLAYMYVMVIGAVFRGGGGDNVPNILVYKI